MSRHSARDVLTPESLEILRCIAESGSFAAAARALDMVPSALTYRVRQMEDALDVLLFDRRSRQAQLTEAGRELVAEGQRLLDEMDAIAHRVKRVATGWESQFTIAVDSIIDRTTVMELCEGFFKLDAPTQLRLRSETLSGTLQALTSGRADLALGVVAENALRLPGLQLRPLGLQRFVFAVAPHHPLARLDEPLTDNQIRPHRAVAAADTVSHGSGLTVGRLKGQDVFTVTTLPAKLEAQLRGLGCGFLPEGMARPYIETGRLIAKRVDRPELSADASYAWLNPQKGRHGKALAWWLEQLESPITRQALMHLRPGLMG